MMFYAEDLSHLILFPHLNMRNNRPASSSALAT
jgi:hypothetical protein